MENEVEEDFQTEEPVALQYLSDEALESNDIVGCAAFDFSVEDLFM